MIRTRPLCFVCLCFLIIQAIFLIVTSGESTVDIPASSIFYDEKEKSVLIRGQVYKKTNTSNIQILYLKNNSKNDSNIMVYDEDFTEVSIGQSVTLQGTTNCFEEARNPGNFDQRLYYAKQNIYGVVWCDKVLTISGEENWLMENLYQFKRQWKEKIYESMGEENGAILAAMLLGEKSNMDSDMKELYQKNGIGHILAISGLHISFIGLGIYKLIRKTGLGYIPSGLIGVLILSLYVLMIGFSVSVIRAFVMLLFRVGADMSGRVYDMLTALVVAAAITAGMEPLFLTDAGFLMSYGAILGLLFVMPAMEKLFPCRLKIVSGAYASLAINVTLFPIMLWFYYEISNYSIILNMVVIPLMSVMLGFGIFGSLLAFWVNSVGKICLRLCNLILQFFGGISRMAIKLPMSRIVFGKPDMWKVILYYIVLVLILTLVFLLKKKEGLKRLRVCFCATIGVFIILMAYQPKGALKVTMLDVGQGDCIFLRGPEGKTYLIDGGSSDVEQVGKYRIEPFLLSQGVGELDCVFLTHGDSDHYSGIAEMLDRQDVGVKINRLVLPSNWKQEKALLEIVELAKAQGISIVVIKAGQSIQEGEMQLECIQPTSADGNVNGNAGSLVLSVVFGEFSMLCTGDVEAEGENVLTKRLTGQEFDVLKVAHHGSRNSSTEAFLKVTRPQIALISAGEKNSYGHPHEETVERLFAIGCKVYETAKKGAITLQTDGNSLTFDCFLY